MADQPTRQGERGSCCYFETCKKTAAQHRHPFSRLRRKARFAQVGRPSLQRGCLESVDRDGAGSVDLEWYAKEECGDNCHGSGSSGAIDQMSESRDEMRFDGSACEDGSVNTSQGGDALLTILSFLRGRTGSCRSMVEGRSKSGLKISVEPGVEDGSVPELIHYETG